MKVIGLTGGIGSGKTTVAKLFQLLDVPVYFADDEARKIIVEDKNVILAIKNLLGNDVYSEGTYNTNKVREIIFNEPDKLYALNAIVHPAVIEHSKKWLLQFNSFPYSIREAAILFESGAHKLCNEIVNVIADQELRIMRVLKRDEITRDDVMKIISKQWSDEMRTGHSNHTISNNEHDALLPQVIALDQKFKITIN